MQRMTGAGAGEDGEDDRVDAPATAATPAAGPPSDDALARYARILRDTLDAASTYRHAITITRARHAIQLRIDIRWAEAMAHQGPGYATPPIAIRRHRTMVEHLPIPAGGVTRAVGLPSPSVSADAADDASMGTLLFEEYAVTLTKPADYTRYSDDDAREDAQQIMEAASRLGNPTEDPTP